MINLCGLFFCIIFPLVISIVLVYIEGVEEGKRMRNNTKRRIE